MPRLSALSLQLRPNRGDFLSDRKGGLSVSYTHTYTHERAHVRVSIATRTYIHAKYPFFFFISLRLSSILFDLSVSIFSFVLLQAVEFCVKLH